MLEADEAYFAQYGEPLFSSHMLDLSEEPDDENIAICVQYFKKMGEFFDRANRESCCRWAAGVPLIYFVYPV
jgi:hypothetical protein